MNFVIPGEKRYHHAHVVENLHIPLVETIRKKVSRMGGIETGEQKGSSTGI